MAVFKGAGCALVTPFKPDGSVNWEQLRSNIEFQIDQEIDAIIVCGTTGEASTMSHEEQIEVIRYCVDVVNERIPVIAGTGSNCTREAIDLSQKAEEVGADGLLIVTPYYNKTSQKGLIEHYKAIDYCVDIPIILYNIPGRTGNVNILPETVGTIISETKNVVGIKDATGDISQVAKMMAYVGADNIDLYSGNDDQVLPILSLGGVGVISVLSNIVPQYVHEMCQFFFEGNIDTCREYQYKAMPLIEALFSDVNPIPVKKAMNILGFNAGILRMPLIDMDEKKEEHLLKCLDDFFSTY
ncbi:MAG: 4-hydroxy-tetrahydrodipicolinate synthase [Clostridia bacterium]|nr:4-hydroxy-tetrahydrodipicolinate synthase [Clostridia bacterium]